MPFLFGHDIFIPILHRLLEHEENPIKYVYGNVRSKWSGGRASFFKCNNLDEISCYLSKLKYYNLTPAITFSSHSIKKEDLRDEFCNSFLDIAYENKSHLIVSSEILYEHIKTRYPDAKMVASVIMPMILRCSNNFDETSFYNEMLDKYDIVVVRPEWTMENIENLNKLVSDIGRIEVLINQSCGYNCPVAQHHYSLIEQHEQNKLSRKELYAQMKEFCPSEKSSFIPVTINDALQQKLISQGVKLFKLQGRSYTFDRICEYLYEFFFSQECNKDEIRKNINSISLELIQKNNFSNIHLL